MPHGESPFCDYNPTQKCASNEKGVLWKRHTMSDWHRNSNPEETAFITHGQLMEEKPYLCVKFKQKPSRELLDHMKGYAEQSAIFSNRIHSAELQPVSIITDHRRRPPRHLDPRIRRWDMNSNMWWPATLAPANMQAGQQDERAEQERRTRVKVRSEAALQRDRSVSMSPDPRTPPRKSLSRTPSKELLRTPSPVSRASISETSSVSKGRRRSQVSNKNPRDEPIPTEMLPEFYLHRGISMRYEKWVAEHGSPPKAPHLPYLTLHGDFRGADREVPLQLGSAVRPSQSVLFGAQVP